MFTSESVNALLAPVSASAPCGANLEYDPDFTALGAAAQGKPEQQFGDTVIAAVEPDWRAVAEQAQALLQRTKDLRLAVLLTRAATHQQGLDGLLLGLQLVTGLLDRYWPSVHPVLDADDGDDPTMRMNALAPLSDESLLLRDLYDAQVGVARSGPLRVREIAMAHGALAASGQALSLAQVAGALAEIQAAQPALASTLAGLAPGIAALQKVVDARSGRADGFDLSRLAALGKLLAQVARTLAPESAGPQNDDPAATGAAASQADAQAGASATAPGSLRGREDALRMLDCVIAYLEQAEPGNPAPLLIRRAKQLIGVSFMDIISNLAPGALDTIKTVTGDPSATD
jgi:type VI secretion system protein ImpA